MVNFSRWRALGALLLCLLLILSAGAGGGTTIPLTPQEEAALYSLKNLSPVDLTPKRVKVEVYIPNVSETAAFIRLWSKVWPRVQSFYARMNVFPEQVPGQLRPGPLTPAQRLRLEVLPQKEWLARTFQAFNVAPPFQLRFLKVCENKYAFAHLPLSTVHFSYQRFAQAVLSSEPGSEPANVTWLANLIIHELGHLFSLYHAHEFTNDPVQEYLPDGRTPNFMSHHLTGDGDMGFVEFQKLMVHSYLSGGKVFQQLRLVEFDPLRHLDLLKRHNGFKEPPADRPPRTAPKAFGDYTEDDDDDDDD